MTLRPRRQHNLGQINLVAASYAAGQLLDIGYHAALPLRDVTAKLARVKLGLVGHCAVGRFRVGV